jgi:hydroxypyruvate isomerase
LQVEDFEVPRRYGLICTMGYAGGGTIPDGLNRTENHAAIETAFRNNLPLARKPACRTSSPSREVRRGMSGRRRRAQYDRRPDPREEDRRGQRREHLPGTAQQQGESPGLHGRPHSVGGARDGRGEFSPNVKLLYDIYHMQIMEGDLIATIRENIAWIGHFHTGGVPGRHELDDTQEVQWDGVMRAIAAAGFKGYVAHEFIPTRDPFSSLRAASGSLRCVNVLSTLPPWQLTEVRGLDVR